MILHIYHGLDNEEVPEDVTHVIVDSSVTVIKENAFDAWEMLVSVIMGDNVKIIEMSAFRYCHVLRSIRLSKTLEHIGVYAFFLCESLEALFLPSTVKSIEYRAFVYCQSLRLMILPNDIDLSNVGDEITSGTGIFHIAGTVGVSYEDENGHITDESSRQVNEWLFHHMDEAPFHKLCYISSITTKLINDYLTENGTDAALAIDPYLDMTPLHMLSMNPHAPADTIAALLNVNFEVAFRVDNQGKTSLDRARDCDVGGLVGMVNGICNHRHAAA